MSSSCALVPRPIDLRPNPLPYGRLPPLAAGAWDQLQARRAYGDGDETPQTRPGAVDKRV